MPDSEFRVSPLIASASTVSVTASDTLAATDSSQRTQTSDLGPGPNQPTGHTQLFHVDGTTKNFDSQGSFFYGQKWGDKTDATEPLGGPGITNRWTSVADAGAPSGFALHNQFYTGDGDGWAGLAEYGDWRPTYGDIKELYFRANLFFSSNWQSHSGGGEKTVSLRIGTANQSSTVHYLHQNSTDLNIRFVYPGGTDGDFRRSSIVPSRGNWYEIEFVINANTVGNADGGGDCWIDGTLVDNFHRLGQQPATFDDRTWNFTGSDNPPGFFGLQFGIFWGGSGDTKTVDDYVRFGQLYVSGKN